MNPVLSIRNMKSTDTNSLRPITHTPFPAFFRSIASENKYSEVQVLVSEQQGIAVGFAKLVKFHVDKDAYGCILGIAVLPQFRRKGIATRLVKSGTKGLKNDGVEAVFATAERINFASLSAFKKAGYRKMSFLNLWRLFGPNIFEFYRDVRFSIGQVVLMHP